MPVTDTEAFLLDTKIRIKGHHHDVGAGVEREPVGRQAAELIGADTSVDNNTVVDAALCLLQLEVEEGELQDKAGRSLQRPHACLTSGVVVWVARRCEDPSGLRKRFITLNLAAQHCWSRITGAYHSDSAQISHRGR